MGDDYYTQPVWRTPAELDAHRWRVLAEFMTDVVNRLERIERKLDEPRRRRTKEVAEKTAE